MASKNLTYNIFGKDRSASRTMETVGARAAKVARRMAVAAAAIAAALAVVVVRFGVESVKAAAEAETAQNKLTDAWAKFPKTADQSIDALREYNSELAKTTRYDDDVIATGQAVLAQFKLTGSQIRKLTPLLLDYAAKTGKDLPTAAKDLGKALLGQMRALKEVGLNLKDTGSVAGNFQLIMAGLSTQVGGFAEKEGTTAAGKLEILKNRFGEVQEAIGFALMPALSDLIDFTNETVLPGLEGFSAWFTETGLPAIREFVGWVIQYKDLLGPAAIALGALTAAQWALNVAMDANPIGAVILGLTASIALITAFETDFMGLKTTVLNGALAIIKGIAGINVGVARGIDVVINSVVNGLNYLLGPLNLIRSLLGMPTISVPHSTFGAAAQAAYGAIVANIGATNSSFTGHNYTGNVSSGFGHNAGSFAAGGIVPARPGGWLATVGEGGQDEAIIPLDRLGGMGGGDTFVFHIGTLIGDDNRAMQKLARKVTSARGVGAITRTAFTG